MWTRVSFVEELVGSMEASIRHSGWQYFRIEYFAPDLCYQEHECGIWLPMTIDRHKLQKEINDAICESYKMRLTEAKARLAHYEPQIDNLSELRKTFGSPEEVRETTMKIIRNCEKEIAHLEKLLKAIKKS